MPTLLRIVHLLAVGLWFGSVTFFSFFTALPIIHRMQEFAAGKPEWLAGLQDEKQGTRLAGEALAPVFARYFPLQLVCGIIALFTSLYWINLPGSIHKLRAGVLALALLLALGNTLFLAPRVSTLRVQRYSPDTQVAQNAEKEFSAWHGYSLVTDMATLLLVAVALGMAASLPNKS